MRTTGMWERTSGTREGGSTIILEYLEDRYPTPHLYPQDVAERARCRQLEAAADEILFPLLFELISEVFYKPAAGGLDERPYLCGDFSVADIGYALTATFAANLGAPLADDQPRLQAWFGRVLSRPSVTKELAGLAGAMEQLA